MVTADTSPPSGAIFEAALDLLAHADVGPDFARSLAAPVEGLHAVLGGAGTRRLPPLVSLPALVHGGVSGRFEPAIPLCGAALLLFIGVDLLDDVMDGDVTPYWQGETASEHLLVASTLLKAPDLAFECLEDRALAADLHSCFARSLVRMASGQHTDVSAGRRSDVTPDQVLDSVARKSGEITSMLARWGAVLARASDDQAAAYAEWGMSYGIADQLRSDCADLFREPVGSDLRVGIFTYPLATLLYNSPAYERAAIERLIHEAATDLGAREALRSLLKEKGSLAITEMRIRWYETVAEGALQRAAPKDPAGVALRALAQPRVSL